uniref:DUF1877 family protein n=1 Tax=Escherichia coli TaxID=562 RepID=UPI001FCECDF9
SVHHIWCPLFSQEFQDLPDGAETTLTIKRLNEMEIYPGVTFSEELEGQLFASIMLDMEKLISAYRRMLRQGNHALTVIVG